MDRNVKESDQWRVQGDLWGNELRIHNALPTHQLSLHRRSCPHATLRRTSNTNVQTEAVLATVPCSLGGLSYDLLRSSVRPASKTQQTETEKKPQTLPTMNTSMGSFYHCDEVYSCHLLCDTGAD